MRRWMTVLGLLSLLLPLLTGGARAEPVTIRLAWVTPVATWGSIPAREEGPGQALAESYVLEPVRFQGTPLMITAMANGELEIGNLAYSTFALAVQNAKLDDLRVISDEFQDGVDPYYSNEFLVLKDSGIEKVADLKGKVLATNSAGSAIDIAMRAMLRRHGLEDETRLLGGGSAVPGDARHAGGKESRDDAGGAAVCARSGAQTDRAHAVHQQGRNRALAVRILDRAQSVPRQEPGRHERLHGGCPTHRALVSQPGQPRRGHAASRRA